MAERLAITTDFITLAQLLKITDIIKSGGQAKAYLANEEVLLNGEQENRRGKKLYPGDLIETAGEAFVIEEESAEEAAERAEKAAILARFQAKEKKAAVKKSQSTPSKKKKPARKKPTGPSSWN
ncbi:S4 domain-containing protein YaaA [Fructobacillus sp. M2-14]|uniref:S4 domain-containing protein YaaA n=1 Tax=Fructobacillus broussonetiae TaxID=2713173 RepID=A0ABS5QZT6_9LACO|nr:S4 domain-containing protein YaaA [Fructobacillus broussonetiae]MBS9338723.1 S4 domain-containing protein YaaA [Fructobacillus broussonetiae]